ncbi:MAG: ATP-binding cassette domain-containing protein [Planctomycetota bacterium]|nr:ATP-binding cassette domain-containing protein [Planctomycetota bacterium]
MGNGETTRPDAAPEYLIRLEHVHKQFGKHVIFEDLSIGFRKGETTVVLGASGVGKSVLLKLILGLLRPDSGRIFVAGTEITRLSERLLVPLRKRFGMLFQGAALFDYMTVYENVSFALHEHKSLPEAEMRRIVAQKLALVDMAGTENLLPEELSGGMRKRVGLARAIAMEPDAILYDEPTTGLDPVTADTINDLILRCQKELKTTGIVVTHDMASAYKVADRMILLFEGEVIADAAPDQIRRHPDIRVQRFIHGDASLQAAPPAS